MNARLTHRSSRNSSVIRTRIRRRNKDLDTLEREAVRNLRAALRGLRAEILRNVNRTLTATPTDFHEWLKGRLYRASTEAFVRTFITSMRRSKIEADRNMKAGPRALALSLDPNVERWARAMGVDPTELERIFARYAAEHMGRDLDNTAQVVTEIVARQWLSDAPKSQKLERVQEDLRKAGLTKASPTIKQLETNFRTGTQIMYSAGQYAYNQDPAIQDILWGYEYVAVMDDRVRDAHAAMNGVRMPKQSDVWLSWWPPNGYNCRCTLIEIFTGDRQATQAPPPPGVEPDTGFAVNLGATAQSGTPRPRS